MIKNFTLTLFVLSIDMRVDKILLLLVSTNISLIQAVVYKFTKIENCTTSDDEFAEIETCTASKLSGINVAVNLKVSLSKILVNYFEVNQVLV